LAVSVIGAEVTNLVKDYLVDDPKYRENVPASLRRFFGNDRLKAKTKRALGIGLLTGATALAAFNVLQGPQLRSSFLSHFGHGQKPAISAPAHP
jgi:hypothetical protein